MTQPQNGMERDRDRAMDCRNGPVPMPRELRVDVVADDPQWTALGALDPTAVIAEVTAAISAHLVLPAALTTATVALCSDAEVRALNSTWRGLDEPTNVLSFPSPEPASPARHAASERFLGDVILAEETLACEAADLAIDSVDHFRHLVLHGLLHLLGYDHETDAEAAVMEALETRILHSIGVADPYIGTEPVTVARLQAASDPGKATP